MSFFNRGPILTIPKSYKIVMFWDETNDLGVLEPNSKPIGRSLIIMRISDINT